MCIRDRGETSGIGIHQGNTTLGVATQVHDVEPDRSDPQPVAVDQGSVGGQRQRSSVVGPRGGRRPGPSGQLDERPDVVRVAVSGDDPCLLYTSRCV